MAQGNGNAASDAAVAAAAAAAAAAASAGNTSHSSLLQHMTGATFRGQDGGGQTEVNVDHQDHVHGKDDFFDIFIKTKHHSILIL